VRKLVRMRSNGAAGFRERSVARFKSAAEFYF
jgi:hypothetical protein